MKVCARHGRDAAFVPGVHRHAVRNPSLADALCLRQAQSSKWRTPTTRRVRRAALQRMAASTDMDTLNLPPALKKMVLSLQGLSNPRVRYQQLLHMASTLPKMDDSLKTLDNKVPGCLSVVHVAARLDDSDQTLHFSGDSDAQLTKGLVALLIRGLDGCTAEEVERVDPSFIKVSGLSVSLTPGRNNGFLNMLKSIKQKAIQLASNAQGNGVDHSAGRSDVEGDSDETFPPDEFEDDFEERPNAPIYNAINRKLRKLKPVDLEVDNFSDQHAHHRSKPDGSETHFGVRIVADAFEGLNAVKRHQLIYAILADEVANGIHALTIDAKTPAELQA